MAVFAPPQIASHQTFFISVLRTLERWRFVLDEAVYEDVSSPIERDISFMNRAFFCYGEGERGGSQDSSLILNLFSEYSCLNINARRGCIEE
jgi:hypothetical protein